MIAKARPCGFTLIELLATLAIVSLLAMTVLPVAQLAQQRIREQALRRALAEIRSAIDAYKQASDEGRVEKKADSSGYPATLSILAEGIPDRRDPKRRKIYFLRRVPRDPLNSDASLSAEDSYQAFRKGKIGEGVKALTRTGNLGSLGSVLEELPWIIRF